MTESAVCCVSTYNQLHHALALARSIRASWVQQPTVFVLLLDHPELERPGFDALRDIRFLSPADLDLPALGWLVLKFSPLELCCACKPYLLDHVLKRGFDIVWYIDTDLLFFSDPAAMRDLAQAHDLVVTPHILSPIPDGEAWTRPTMGHLSAAGILNAGLFTARPGPAAFSFLAQWSGMVTAQGTCLAEFGDFQEQHAFNQAVAPAQGVCQCRDPRINVAYWNLHERPLRWSHLDGGERDQWLLDGQPISCFHFSGLDWKARRLSSHDHRHHLGLNVNLYELAAHYDRQLEAAHRKHYARAPYGFGRVGPLALNHQNRLYLKLLEARETLCFPAPSDRDAVFLADRLLSIRGRCTILPRLLEDVLLHRADLLALAPGEVLFPLEFLRWSRHFLELEYGDGVPLFHSSFLAVHRRERAELLRRCTEIVPDEDEAWIADALVSRRAELRVKLLARRSAAPDPAPLNTLIGLIDTGRHLVPAFNPVLALRMMLLQWPSAFRKVPPLGSCPIRVFRERIRLALREHFIWPEAHEHFLEQFDPEISLARVLSVLRRQPAVLATWRQGDFSRHLLLPLLPYLPETSDFNATDVALLDWLFESSATPAPGLVRQIRRMLGAGLRRGGPRPTPGTGGDGIPAATLDKRLLPFLADEADETRWHGYLSWWAAKNQLESSGAEGEGGRVAALGAVLRSADWRGLGDVSPALAPAEGGLNIFGYFKSPIGLGQMSRGIASAQRVNGNPWREIVLTNMTMASDLRLEDLYPDFAFHFPRNLAVTYPHINHNLDELFPPVFFRGRETIGYVAWEQRDLHPAWGERLAFYDRLFALSGFAAESLSRATGRDCQALPCVVAVDVDRAKARQRRDYGLPEEAFVAGLMFDATSSIERKNPLAAARALVRAYGGRPDVTVVVKVNNGGRPQYRRAVDNLCALLSAGGIDYRLITGVMERAELEGLMAQLDLYISLHRCEGFGYSIAEAMWLGVPVVATAYSGNMDFMNDANSYPVRFRETVVRENDGPFQLGTVWADPDVAHAAELCDHVYLERGAARVKAALAERDIRSLVSVEAVARRLLELLR